MSMKTMKNHPRMNKSGVFKLQLEAADKAGQKSVRLDWMATTASALIIQLKTLRVKNNLTNQKHIQCQSKLLPWCMIFHECKQRLFLHVNLFRHLGVYFRLTENLGKCTFSLDDSRINTSNPHYKL